MNIYLLTFHLVNSMLIYYFTVLHLRMGIPDVTNDFLFNIYPLIFFPIYTVFYLVKN